MSKKISIIIPVFNREHVLDETLESVLNQTNANWECIIVDDGSSDSSVQIAKRYQLKDERFRFYSRLEIGKPKGVSACRNIGIENAKGKFVIFLDSDDLLASTCLENRIAFQLKNSEYDFWIFQMQEFNETGKGKLCNLYPKIDTEKEYLKMILNGSIPFSVTCPLWKLNILKELKGFDENMQRLEDPDLHARAFMNGFRLKVDKEAVPDCFYRLDDDYRKRYLNKKFIEVVQKSYFKFITKHLSNKIKNDIISFNEIKRELSSLLLHVYQFYVFKPKNFKGLLLITKYGLKFDLLPLKKVIPMFILFIYEKLQFSKVKRSGYFKLKSLVFKSNKIRI